jgi:hypothetical protein
VFIFTPNHLLMQVADSQPGALLQQQQRAPQDDQERISYATHMRQLFSPADMLQHDGSINQEFFRPNKVVTLADRKWGDAEREQLYRGLEQYGVGKWRQMADDMLKGWDDTSIRLKAAKLLGSQNLSRYYGRCITKAQAEAELQANKQLGAQTGCWKNGMLVDDDSGTLAAHFRQQQEHQQQEQQQQQQQDV